MGRVRRQGTDLEIRLRKALWSSGLRYKLKTKIKLPGTPDILFPGAKLAIFVDGCFWHGCTLHGTQSKTNPDFWAAKIARNQERDKQVDEKLAAIGWRSIRFWQHDIENRIDDCVATVADTLEKRL